MKPVQIEFLMVDHLSARLDKAVGKIERMSQQASSANRQIRELDRSGSLLNNTVGKLAAAFTIKELVSNITKVRGEFQQIPEPNTEQRSACRPLPLRIPALTGKLPSALCSDGHLLRPRLPFQACQPS